MFVRITVIFVGKNSQNVDFTGKDIYFTGSQNLEARKLYAPGFNSHLRKANQKGPSPPKNWCFTIEVIIMKVVM